MLGSLAKRVGPQQIVLNKGSQFATGLVGWWPMGNQACWGSKTLLDMSLYSNDGTLVTMDSADWVADGRPGLEFDGSSDYVDLGNNPETTFTPSTDELTFCCWVTGPAGATTVIAGKWDGSTQEYAFYEQSGGTVNAIVGGSIHSTGIALTSVPKHLLVTNVGWLGNKRIRVYIDGVRTNTGGSSTGSETTTTNLVIGRRQGDADRYFGGKIDDVRVYNRGMGDAEVAQLYNETKDGSYGSLAQTSRPKVFAINYPAAATVTNNAVVLRNKPIKRVGPSQVQLNRGSQLARGLVGWYPMGNQACWGTNTLLDMSLYDNDGTLTNMVPSDDWVLGERSFLDFDGSNDYANIGNQKPYHFTQADSFTFSGWFKVDDFGANGRHALRKDKWSDGAGSTRALFLWKFGTTGTISITFGHSSSTLGGLTSTATVAVGELIHIVSVRDVGQDKIYHYFNGTEESNGTDASTGSWTVNEGTLYLAQGGNVKETDTRMDGRLDDIRIWNRALSAGEVTQLYNETRDGSYGSLALPTGPRIWAVDTTAAAASGVVTSLIGEGGMIGYGGMISRGGGMIR